MIRAEQPSVAFSHLQHTTQHRKTDQPTECEAQMVELARRQPVMVFRIMDRQGLPIGEIVEPKAAPVLGRGAGTVLLVREGQQLE
ncbi:MAG TPA: hypothetical protein VHH32_13855 [Gemmatimonadales bacterium]|nr:hypothetical protein [Gemmatimonadales bacterium]